MDTPSPSPTISLSKHSDNSNGQQGSESTPRVLILVVAYEAESHIKELFARIKAAELHANKLREYHILLIDDASKDKTTEVARAEADQCPLPTTILKNPINLGYGGNQKVGYHYAIREGYSSVVLLHGDCQYPPELIDAMTAPIETGIADVVFGSRMLNKKDALKGGMPLYKWVGNQILTKIQNTLLGTQLSECHTGFRAYRVGLLKSIPFRYNANNFHFDADIIIQCHRAGARMTEIPIPTRYGNEVCRVDGIRYGINCLKSGLSDYLTQLEIFYSRKFDLQDHPVYQSKLGMEGSSHSLALSLVPPNSTVTDLGGGNGVIAKELVKKGCSVTVVDNYLDFEPTPGITTVGRNLEELTHVPEGECVLMLDIIEHIPRKEQFKVLEKVREMSGTTGCSVIISVPNSVFLPVRLMNLFGRINYGRRGILDETHAFLFTRSSLRELLESSGYTINGWFFPTAPFGIVFKNKAIASTLTGIQTLLTSLLPGLFAYQLMVVASPKPSVASLLKVAEEHIIPTPKATVQE